MFVLILFAHVGIMSSGNSNSLTSVSGFKTYELCKSAGEKARSMATSTVKEIDFVCVKVD
jgi:hypothetical protein